MLHYLAELGEKVEKCVPHPNDSLKEHIRIAKTIVEDERLLARKGIQSAIDPDARFGWKSNTTSFFG
jgi:desulfoferrodoxin (superoxide reductase-like protein)